MAVLRGEEGDGYVQLEDSLATFARALAAASRPQRGGAAKRADGTVEPDDADTPGVRRRQQRARTSTTSRTPAGTASGVPTE